MYYSDVSFSCSTHELLLSVLFCETGLGGAKPSPLEKQLLVISQCFEPIREKVVSKNWTDKKAFQYSEGFSGIEVSQAADAELFVKLYSAINNAQNLEMTPGCVMRLLVYPMVGKMVNAHPSITDALRVQLEAYADQFGPKVKGRIERSLTIFGIAL